MEGQGRGPGTSRNLKVMVNIQRALVNLTKKVKGNFVSLRLVYFLIHLKMLIHEYVSNTEQNL